MNFITTPPLVLLVHFTQINVVFATQVVHMMPQRLCLYLGAHAAELLRRQEKSDSQKGKGFHQPAAPHRHWHIDITSRKIKGVFY
jgi:hypothetical protein